MGWRDADFFKNQGAVIFQFMESTDPRVTGDPDYEDQGPSFPRKDRLQYQISLPAPLNPCYLRCN